MRQVWLLQYLSTAYCQYGYPICLQRTCIFSLLRIRREENILHVFELVSNDLLVDTFGISGCFFIAPNVSALCYREVAIGFFLLDDIIRVAAGANADELV